VPELPPRPPPAPCEESDEQEAEQIVATASTASRGERTTIMERALAWGPGTATRCGRISEAVNHDAYRASSTSATARWAGYGGLAGIGGAAAPPQMRRGDGQRALNRCAPSIELGSRKWSTPLPVAPRPHGLLSKPGRVLSCLLRAGLSRWVRGRAFVSLAMGREWQASCGPGAWAVSGCGGGTTKGRHFACEESTPQ
jgi:hypothetical protein